MMAGLSVTVFVLVYLGMALGRVPGLALDRTGVALLGLIVLLASEDLTFGLAVPRIRSWLRPADLRFPVPKPRFLASIGTGQIRFRRQRASRGICGSPVPPKRFWRVFRRCSRTIASASIRFDFFHVSSKVSLIEEWIGRPVSMA